MQNEKLKPLILDWLSSLVDHTFSHHFSDVFIHYSIWDDQLCISLDFRQANQQELFDKLPKHIKGTPQRNTGIMVNLYTLYFKVSEICQFDYPEIISHELIKKTKHQSSEKGWYIKGEHFYTYDWKVNLSDGTSITYHNQKEQMDMVKNDHIYNCRIQEREFEKFILRLSRSAA